MDTGLLLGFLVRCAAINYLLLLVWFGAFLYAHDALYRLHTRWFAFPPATFDALNYGAIAVYKMANLLFFIVPAIVLAWMRAG